MFSATRNDVSGHIDEPADRVAIAAERQRVRAFRQARRHTWLVRSLKLVLPLFAVSALGVYGASLYATASLKRANISVSSTRIDPVNLTMVDPRYDGFAKDGSSYRVHAKSAVTDFRMEKPVRLNTIDAQLLQTNGVVTKLDAKWGTYDQKKDILELYDRIDIAGTDGMRAKLTRATVWTKENRIVSDKPVWAEMKTGTIKARTMQVEGKTRKARFANGVEVTLKQDPSKPPTQGGRPHRSRVPSSVSTLLRAPP
ncbi:MAG: LPS export ABC transporter periplasmic protein LptC [Hyphomicrobiaceae bacterium]